jgi:hypothetical protein
MQLQMAPALPLLGEDLGNEHGNKTAPISCSPTAGVLSTSSTTTAEALC